MQQFLEHGLEEPPPQPIFYDENELLSEPRLTDFVIIMRFRRRNPLGTKRKLNDHPSCPEKTTVELKMS
ncbi:hypothetical protein LTR28_011235 [Elasticomyces elasticus]|nr:hypothetical protein LTR28_011235 [Elasticomyces elasticus]